ncbi:MAG: stage 0 sporulation family protein [Candidatus Alcyoniella australis]|nr:stage 0 sporulation family protein [Candidatus Alcyoniella australis]
MRVVKIKFRRSGKRFDFDAGELELRQGQQVVLQIEKGTALGTVVVDAQEQNLPEDESRKPVLRVATDEDLKQSQRLHRRAREAFGFCLRRINERKLPMKLVDAEFLLDESRATFFFTAEGRVDFRELVRDLAHEFRTRIEMMQIGVRDEAKILGGYGICGRELCCASWLVKFNPVSIRMAKDQSLSLNPSKVSGVCGRLMCCLAYEHQQYLDQIATLPRLGKRYVCEQGPCRVCRIDVMGSRVFAMVEGQGEVEISGQPLEPYSQQNRQQDKPEPRPEPRAPGRPRPQPKARPRPPAFQVTPTPETPQAPPAPQPPPAPQGPQEPGEQQPKPEGEGAAEGQPDQAKTGDRRRRGRRSRRRRRRKPAAKTE